MPRKRTDASPAWRRKCSSSSSSLFIAVCSVNDAIVQLGRILQCFDSIHPFPNDSLAFVVSCYAEIYDKLAYGLWKSSSRNLERIQTPLIVSTAP